VMKRLRKLRLAAAAKTEPKTSDETEVGVTG